MPDPGTPFPWDRLRTDLRFPDPAWAFAGLEPGTPAHPVSGLGLHFLSRGCPAPRVRVRFLAPTAGGVRVRWTRDRVDPVFHCPGRHVCELIVPGLEAPEPYDRASREPALPPALAAWLENALLQDAELGFLQSLEAKEVGVREAGIREAGGQEAGGREAAHGVREAGGQEAAHGVRIERLSRGMLGPLWSAAAAPASVAGLFDDFPGAWVFHLPVDEVLREPGPCVADDPLSPLFGDGGPLAARMARLRADVPYRVLRQRRAVYSGPPELGRILERLFPGWLAVPLDPGVP